MAKVESFEDLWIWQEAAKISKGIATLSSHFRT